MNEKDLGSMISSTWRFGCSSNICAGDTKRAGHFSIVNLHSWANAWTLFGFMAAGGNAT
jgi:hypothetical protein